MSNRERLLWQLGSELVAMPFDQAEDTIERALRLVAEELGAGAIGRWHSDLTFETSVLGEVWEAAGTGLGLADIADRGVDPEVADQLIVHGFGQFPLRRFLDSSDVPSGWQDAIVLLVLIEFDGGQADTLMLIRRIGDWDEEVVAFCQEFAASLRQAFVRIEMEANLRGRLDLNRFVSALQRRLSSASHETAAAVLEEVLDDLVDRLDVESVGFFEMTDVLECVHHAGRPFDMDWSQLNLTERPLGLADGADAMVVLSLADVRTGLGQQVGQDALEGEVGLVLLGEVDGRRRGLVAVRAGHLWNDVEQDAIVSVGRSAGEMLARVDAERWAGFHLRVQEEFAATLGAFLRGSADDFDDLVSDALGRVAGSIGASIAAIVNSDDPPAASCGRVVALWAEQDMASPFELGGSVRFPERWVNDAVAAGETVITSFVMEDQLLGGNARGGGRRPVWTLICTSLADWPDGSASVGVLLREDQVHRGPLVVELLESLGDLLDQLCVRLELEREARWREGVQRYIGSAASTLAEAGEHEFDDALSIVLGRGADFLSLDDIAMWSVETTSGRPFLRSRPTLLTGEREGDDLSLWEISEVGRTGEDVIDGDRAFLPRREPDQTTVLAVRRRGEPIAEREVHLLRSVLEIVSRAQRRVTAERNAQTAFGQSPIGVVLLTGELEIVTCNPAFAVFLGYDSPDSVVSLCFDDVLDTKPDKMIEGTSEFLYRRFDGENIWGLTHSTPVESATTGKQMWLIHVEDATERRRAEELLRHQAETDELTGLANRRVLTSRAQSAIDLGSAPTVLLLDLDRFKVVNDSLGHDRGDELLVVLADRLRLAIRPGDTVVRLGGDEFAVILEDPSDEADAQVVADRLLSLFKEPVLLAGQSVFVTASIGIAQASPSTTVSDLLRAADVAMYRAKSLGGSQSVTFDRVMQGNEDERLQVEIGLRQALHNGGLSVHYQPEFSMADGRFLGAEALVRWEHPIRGPVPARSFISVAEESGMITEIDSFVLREACRQAVSWQDSQSTVRVNFSAAQLQQSGTVQLIRETIEETGLPAERLCVEITESAMMKDIERAEQVLRDLKEIGVGVALDDFGTGFSSLAYLKRFPVDTVKIDRAFVGDLDAADRDDAIVRSIISLADALELDVVAEGVETQAQVDALLKLGCERGQGYFYARPMPVRDLARHIATSV